MNFPFTWINSTWWEVLNVNLAHCGSSKLDKDINMDTCGPSCCHEHQQQQQQQHPLYHFRHRLPSGNQCFLNKLALRKPLRPEPFNYIHLKLNYRLTLPRSITNVHHLHPPPPPPVPVHHQFGTFISGYSLPGEIEKNVKTKETRLILPAWPFRSPFYHTLHSFSFLEPILIHSPPLCLFLFLSCHLHCEQRLRLL